MFLAAAAVAMAGLAQAAGPSKATVEYSADSELETAEISMKGHVNYAPTRERREMVTDGGDKMITIMRPDKKVAWILMPSEKMYMETNIAQAAGKDNTDPSQYKIEQTVIGPETLNGVQTTKSKIIMTGPKGEKMGGFMWMTKENIMVKMDAIAIEKNQKMRFKTELTNLKIGKQDASLFEIPPGYSKAGMPSMGSLMGGGDKDSSSSSNKKSAAGEKEPEKSGFGFMDAVKLLK
jgi:outer membrane lipoprotein-sorting protein